MNVDRRLTLLGVMLVVLSMTMATQYATTRIHYAYSIVHPSVADIRFVGSDNTSGGNRLLRVANNASGSQYLEVELGNWSPRQEKRYTAAFAIVNEENFAVNISHINVSGSSSSHNYMTIWLHGNRALDAAVDSGVLMVNNGTTQHTIDTAAWVLAAGDQNTSSMDGSNHNTGNNWDTTANVQYSLYDVTAVNSTDDYVWVQIDLYIPNNAAATSGMTGQIYIHFASTTH